VINQGAKEKRMGRNRVFGIIGSIFLDAFFEMPRRVC
jgi:hypothetical protein